MTIGVEQERRYGVYDHRETVRYNGYVVRKTQWVDEAHMLGDIRAMYRSMGSQGKVLFGALFGPHVPKTDPPGHSSLLQKQADFAVETNVSLSSNSDVDGNRASSPLRRPLMLCPIFILYVEKERI